MEKLVMEIIIRLPILLIHMTWIVLIGIVWVVLTVYIVLVVNIWIILGMAIWVIMSVTVCIILVPILGRIRTQKSVVFLNISKRNNRLVKLF